MFKKIIFNFAKSLGLGTLIFTVIFIIALMLTYIYAKPINLNYIITLVNTLVNTSDKYWLVIKFMSLMLLFLMIAANRKVLIKITNKLFRIPYLNFMDKVVISFILGASVFEIIVKWVITTNSMLIQSINFWILCFIQIVLIIFSFIRIFL